MLPPMLALRLCAAAVVVSVLLAAALGSCGGPQEIWACIDPATGKLDDNAPYDPNHYTAAGVYDPCHCYDPAGPRPQCPILVDGGPDADAGPDAP